MWDAHKDMTLATLGALIALLVTLAVNHHYQRDFARVGGELEDGEEEGEDVV